MTEPREHATLREDVRSWLASNPTPSADFEVPRTAMTVADEAPLEYLRSWQARLYDAGFVGVEWPEAYGGRGLGRGAQGIADQELAAANTPPLLNIVALNWAGPIILRHGTDDQKRRYLAPLLRCDEIWCQGFSEPGAGSDLASLQTRAVREGDGYRIDGEKVWTTLGRFADQMILLARTNPDEARHAGISASTASSSTGQRSPPTRCWAARARAGSSPWRRCSSSAAPRRVAPDARAARAMARSRT